MAAAKTGTVTWGRGPENAYLGTRDVQTHRDARAGIRGPETTDNLKVDNSFNDTSFNATTCSLPAHVCFQQFRNLLLTWFILQQ